MSVDSMWDVTAVAAVGLVVGGFVIRRVVKLFGKSAPGACAGGCGCGGGERANCPGPDARSATLSS